MEAYAWAKALHLVCVVSWFAGLFYLGRLFIYHAEALQKSDPERSILASQYALMERRLWRAITTPAMIGTVIFGLWLMEMTRAWTQPWFHVKLVFVFLLLAYHGFCGRIRRQLAEGRCNGSLRALRLWNETATLLLFAIVFTTVFKRPLGAGYGLVAVVILGLVGGAVFFLSRRSKHSR